jgi:hypothetical protein
LPDLGKINPINGSHSTLWTGDGLLKVWAEGGLVDSDFTDIAVEDLLAFFAFKINGHLNTIQGDITKPSC